jgi:protein TonB
MQVLGLLAVACSAVAQDAPKKVTQAEATSAVVSKVSPEYPEMARKLRLSGSVELEATVGENGSVSSIKIVSGNPVLTRAASAALLKWKFKPFTENGTPVKAIVPLSFDFKP